MTTLINEYCEIMLFNDTTYTIDSADNFQYDEELNLDVYTANDHYSALVIKFDWYERQKSIVLIGSKWAVYTDFAVLAGDLLTVMQQDVITQFNVRNGSIIRHVKFSCYGSSFGIYRVTGGYIVYGELEIIMLDDHFQRKWDFSGRDIFVTNSSHVPFELSEKSIKLYDWEDNYYELDYDGKLIAEKPKRSAR